MPPMGLTKRSDSPAPIPPVQAARNDALKRKATLVFLVVATLAGLCLCYVIARPFIEPIVFAAVMAIVFYPLHARIERRLRRPNLAALASTLLVLLMVVVPLIGLGSAVTRELTQAYQWLSEKSAEGGGWAPYALEKAARPLGWLGRHVDLSRVDVRSEIRSRVEEVSATVVRSVGGVLSHLTTFLFNAVISFFTLFFLFREGRRIRLSLAAVLPLDPPRVERLFTSISDTVTANVYGVLAVAAAQGVLTSLAFWFLGLRSPIVWGVLAAGCSLVPVAGAAIVWLPAALILMASGHWPKGLIMLVWGAGVSGADHLIRPYVIGGRVRMNRLLVFFALLGGLKAFGLLGIFIGPIALSVTSALLGMLREEGSRQ